MALIVVLGGVRSGKSAHAEALAARSGRPVVYVATYVPTGSAGPAEGVATPGAAADPEMHERIALHRHRRPADWHTVEAGDPLAALGEDLARAGDATVLVDGLSGWVAALMVGRHLFPDDAVAAWGPAGLAAKAAVLAAVGAFGAAAARRPAPTIVVADEVGLGGVAMGASARRFADLAGEAAQVLAREAEAVWLVVAGHPLALKGAPGPGRDGRAGASPDPASPDPASPDPASPDPASPDLGRLRVHGDTQVPPGALDFAVSVVPGGPPPAVRADLQAGLDAVGRYPDEARALAALSARHGRPPEEILVLNGAAEGFWLLASVLVPRLAVCVHPSFTEAEAALRTLGRPVVRAFRDPGDFSLDPGVVDAAADLVTVGNPNNPTGGLDAAGTLERLARPGRVVVVDEAFMDFVAYPEASLAGRRDLAGLVVVRSLTKIWGLPGIRAGYLLGPADLVARLAAARQPWSVNGPALAAIEAYGTATGPTEAATAAIAARVAEAREALTAGLAALGGVQVWPGVANFLLIAVADGPRVRAGLLERGIAVRRADTFPGLTRHHLRLAVRSHQDNARLLAAMAEVL